MKRKKRNCINEEILVINLNISELVKGQIRKIVFLMITLLFLNGHLSTLENAPNNNLAYASKHKENGKSLYLNAVKSNMQKQLVNEVECFINQFSPESELTPLYLVERCLEYDIDIVFVLSQGVIESHLGTKGKAASTNSVWNVGTYDDGQILYTYENPDSSIVPYLELLNEKYLINITSDGDTVYKDLSHLIQDKGYINHRGNRFASARGYENGIRDLMVRIDMETSISFYQGFFKLSDDELFSFFNEEQIIKSNEFFALN